MTTVLNVLDKFIFSGVPSNAAWDLIKYAWEQSNQADWEDLYLKSFQWAIESNQERLARYANDGEVSLDERALHQALHQDLVAPVELMSLSELTDDQFSRALATRLHERNALVIGGHNLSESDYAQLTRNFVQAATSRFKETVHQNETSFRQAMLREAKGNNELVRDAQQYLSTQLELMTIKLDTIETKMGSHGEQLEAIESSLDAIREHLNLERSTSEIAAEIQTSLNTAGFGPMFEHGGLCNGFALKPFPNRYFVAQEFSEDRDDLLNALSKALSEFEVQPIRADKFIWPGHILCKISSLIQSTPFGVYQLGVSQNRNVYLELGIAMGLGRPFILVKEKLAEVTALADGLEYHQIDSYLELRYGLGEKVRPFLTQIGAYQIPFLPNPGSRGSAVISHGDLDVIDFCVPIAQMLAQHGFMPIILGDPTHKLSGFLTKRRINHEILDGFGRSRLDELTKTIQAAKLGVYRIDKTATADAFMTLGVSMGLNRPGLLVHHSNSTPPSNLRGLSTLEFNAFTILEKEFPIVFERSLRRYGR